MKAILVTLLLCCFFSTSARYNVLVYRNDSVFNQIKITDGKWLRHSINSDKITADFDDLISGDISVPISAIDSCVVCDIDIPVLRISFPDFPDVPSLWEKDLYINALIDIDGNGFCDDAKGLELLIKGRGNSTWEMEKKPMRLKFPKKTSICGLGKMKNYVLLNNHIDPSLMRNVIAMWLARRIGIPFTNSMVPCNVFINGFYAGSYTLTEKIGINSGSVDIKEEEGLLLEASIEFDEKYKFHSRLWKLPMMVKDPDFDDMYSEDPAGLSPEERLSKWEENWNNAETALSVNRGAEAFDMQSAVDFIFVNEFVCNHELGNPKSLFFYKKSLENGEKFFLGPVWDFDNAFNCKRWDSSEMKIIFSSPETDTWMHGFLSKLRQQSEFKRLYAARLKEFEETIFPELLQFFDYYAALIAPSAKLNAMRWPGTEIIQGWAYREPTFDTEFHTSELRNWLIARKNYLCLKNKTN